jgi:hypothetical protein
MMLGPNLRRCAGRLLAGGILAGLFLSARVVRGRDGGLPSVLETWTPLPFACPGVKSKTSAWKPIRSRDRSKKILDAAKAIPLGLLEEGHPTSCRLRISERCAPDFDGDGALDLVYRIAWFVPTGVPPLRCPAAGKIAEGDENTLLLLVRSKGDAPQVLWHDWGGERSGDLSFGKDPSGKVAILVEEGMTESESGCFATTRRIVDGSTTPVRDVSTKRDRTCDSAP